MFEISVIERNNNGDPILKADGSPKRRYFKSDSADAISDFWMRNGNHKKGKRKTKAATKPEEIKNAIKEINEYVDLQTTRCDDSDQG